MSEIDQDVISFLRVAYFGGGNDDFVKAVNKAYLDFNRTIRFENCAQELRLRLKIEVTNFLKDEIIMMLEQIRCQEEYDDWHQRVCVHISKLYSTQGISFFIGQSQKWLNMTLKYLYVLGYNEFSEVFSYFHIPVDNFIFAIAKNELNIKKTKVAWSRIVHYSDYLNYQKKIREEIGTAPLHWELNEWNRYVVLKS